MLVRVVRRRRFLASVRCRGFRVAVALAQNAPPGAKGTTEIKGRVAFTELPPLLLRLHLIPAEREQTDNVSRYAEAAALADGSFAVNHLAPGHYFIIARAADKESTNLTPQPLAWDTAARSVLRREAESANVALELTPCQRVSDYSLRYPKQ